MVHVNWGVVMESHLQNDMLYYFVNCKAQKQNDWKAFLPLFNSGFAIVVFHVYLDKTDQSHLNLCSFFWGQYG
jgi:hypothetical protein